MPFFLDTQEAAQRFGGEIAEFGALLDVNRIRHGSPNDLFEFARLLEHSQQLRSDLSALVQSVVRRAHEEILLTDMMGILAAAVGGPSIAETRVDITRPTNVLMEFLLGTGCWRNFGSPARASQSERPSFKPSARGEASGELPISPAASASAEEKIEDRASLLDISNELRQTLSRLESSAMQVKLHLDSIEQKIAKAEPPQAPPRWEAPALEPLRPVAAEPERLRQAARAPEPLPRHTAAPAPLIEKVVRSPAEEPSEPELPTRGRAIFSHFLPEEEVRTEEENFSSPTFAYAAEGGRNMIPVGVFLALVVVLIAAFCFAYSSYGRGVLSSGIARLKSSHAWLGGASAPVTPPPAPKAAIMPGSTATAAAEGSTTPTATPAGTNGGAPAQSDLGASRFPAAASASGNAGIRYVSANVMEGRLLSAPRPMYPPVARLNRIAGQVVLQATVSKSGSIVTLHVVKGPPALRRAALDAVRHWRYKPYVVDGRARDVATTVYVDFTLRAPPAIVH